MSTHEEAWLADAYLFSFISDIRITSTAVLQPTNGAQMLVLQPQIFGVPFAWDAFHQSDSGSASPMDAITALSHISYLLAQPGYHSNDRILTEELASHYDAFRDRHWYPPMSEPMDEDVDDFDNSASGSPPPPPIVHFGVLIGCSGKPTCP